MKFASALIGRVNMSSTMGSWNSWHEDEIFGESNSPKKVSVTYLNVLVYII